MVLNAKAGLGEREREREELEARARALARARMAHLGATSRVAWVYVAVLFLWRVVAGRGAVESERQLLNFEVSLPDGSERVDFLCDLGSGGFETQNGVLVDSSELVDLMDQVVVVSHRSAMESGGISCWHEKLGTSLPSSTVDALSSQIQAFLSHRLRSLLENEADSSPAPSSLKDGSDKVRLSCGVKVVLVPDPLDVCAHHPIPLLSCKSTICLSE